ncbi:MAG TPA: hypothetical protein VN903_37075 [Polyangia bacterium]|jgi:hypothetical protein|nr:hypothetical protein [Polyangia bacterium]
MTVVAQAQDRLGQALACFVDAYQSRPELVAEQRGWSPIIVLAASDADARVVVSLEDGRVARVGGAAKVPTLEVTAGLDILCDVLMLRRDPNEPYLFGELSVLGAEADFVRLDYIVSRLCPQ